MSVMRSTKAGKCCNSFHSPAAANQATASLLNYMTFVFDVFSTRISTGKKRHLQTVATVLKRLQGDSK